MNRQVCRRCQLVLGGMVMVMVMGCHTILNACSRDDLIWAKDKRSNTPLWVITSLGEKESRFGFVDSQGQVRISPTFPYGFNFEISDFFEGLLRVGIGDQADGRKYGFINVNGEMQIAPQFSQADDFSNGLAWVYLGEGRWGYIDGSGSLVLEPDFENGGRFHEGHAVVERDGLKGFIDPTGALVIPTQYLVAREFSEGLAAVVRAEESPCAVISSSPCLSRAVRVSRDLSGDDKDQPWPACKFTFVNPDGEEAFVAQFEDARHFSEGLAAVAFWENNRQPIYDSHTAASWREWGYVDREGNVVVSIQFQDAGPFVEGMARVRIDGKYGFIDREGNYRIKPEFTRAEDFSEGYAIVSKDTAVGRWTYWFIDKEGKRAFEGQYKEATSFHLGRAHVELIVPPGTARTWAYIDTTGSVVFRYTGLEDY